MSFSARRQVSDPPAALRARANWSSGALPCRAMAFRVVTPADLQWITRPHEPGKPARHGAELSDAAGFAHTRGNVWRYEPGAKGRRHRHRLQEETFVVLAGTLSMYVGDPPERQDVHAGALIHIDPGTALQATNHGTD